MTIASARNSAAIQKNFFIVYLLFDILKKPLPQKGITRRVTILPDTFWWRGVFSINGIPAYIPEYKYEESVYW